MTNEQIDALEAGREMDERIAREVMGLEVIPHFGDVYTPLMDVYTTKNVWTVSDRDCVEVERYSTDIAAAWKVVENLEKRKILFSATRRTDNYGNLVWFVHFRQCVEPFRDWFFVDGKLTVAICRAALNAVNQ